MEEIRLNHFLAMCGLCSRREADRMIADGLILVNGVTADVGRKVNETDEVVYDGRRLTPEAERIVLAVNKPEGIVCTTAHFKGEKNIVELVGLEERIFPVGRLDKASKGLILMTNDGRLSDEICRSVNGHEKEYIVTVDKSITAEFLENMRGGVELSDAVTKPCRVKKLSARSFSIILTQGLNRQIRRMCEALEYRVRELTRIRVMNITIDGIPEGGYRRLTESEIRELGPAARRKK